MRITTAPQAAQRDANAIAAGTDSWELMYAAGKTAAHCIITSTEPPPDSITVFAGTGNNGGDAYVVAAILRRHGFNVLLIEAGEPRTADAKRARTLYEEALAEPLLRTAHGRGREERSSEVDWSLASVLGPTVRHVGRVRPVAADDTAPTQPPPLVIDGLLGTGQRGALRDPEAKYAAIINDLASRGAVVIALDLPTGVNATTGEIAEDAVRADHTIAFGTMKRAHVLQREQCGAVTVVNIGLEQHAEMDDGAWIAGDETLLAPRVPLIAWNAYKGTRGKLALVGGNAGMAGAIVLAANAALRSGIGMLHAHVHPDSAIALQASVPQALAHDWHHNSEYTALAIGPGLGRTPESLKVLGDALHRVSPDVAVLLDADALTLIGTDTNRLRALSFHRWVLCTPHVGELARLLGADVAETLEDRVAQASELAKKSGATILLKGSPTVIVGPRGETPVVVARGNAALATGGSGDLLTGIVGTLLAQGANAMDAAAIGAWVHGRAAEVAVERAGGVRGVTLEHVLDAMAAAWGDLAAPREDGAVIGGLPSVTRSN